MYIIHYRIYVGSGPTIEGATIAPFSFKLCSDVIASVKQQNAMAGLSTEYWVTPA